MILEIILIILAALIFIILYVFGYGIGTFNKFKNGKQDINVQWSNIKTEYQRRADLFYNLAQSVKSLKNFEKDTFIHVAQARSGHFGGGTKLDEMKRMKGLDGFFNRLMVVMEKYPTLKAPKRYDKLMEEIRITEDRINVARTDYNEIVGDYNKLATFFPSNLIAGMFRFSTEEFFKNEESTDKAPKLDLD